MINEKILSVKIYGRFFRKSAADERKIGFSPSDERKEQ
jgi:hypothetical protein